MPFDYPKGVLMGNVWFKNLLCIITAATLMALSGCASYYVDTALTDVPQEAIEAPESPQPIQVVFEFRTKGAANAAATEYLKDQVYALVSESGLFSQVDALPTANERLLSIVIDNIPITDDAMSKGFVTGLTFGLAGNTVTDGYLCTFDFTDGKRKPIHRVFRHAIHATLGAEGAPEKATKADSLDAAVRTMTRHVVRNGLASLSTDPRFNQQ